MQRSSSKTALAFVYNMAAVLCMGTNVLHGCVYRKGNKNSENKGVTRRWGEDLRTSESRRTLLEELDELEADSYTAAEQVILKYAVSLLEILSKRHNKTTWTEEEFAMLPGAVELDEGVISAKWW